MKKYLCNISFYNETIINQQNNQNILIISDSKPDIEYFTNLYLSQMQFKIINVIINSIDEITN